MLRSNITEISVIVVDVALIALFITAVSIIAYQLSIRAKFLILVVLLVWTLIPLAGFQYSYISIFTGNILMETIFTVLVNISANYFALKELGSIEFGFTKVSVRSSSQECKDQGHYGKYSPIRSIYAYYLSQLNITARISMGGTTSVTNSRVKLAYLFLPMLGIAIVYAVLAQIFESGEFVNIVILLGTAYVCTILPILLSQRQFTIMHQRK